MEEELDALYNMEKPPADAERFDEIILGAKRGDAKYQYLLGLFYFIGELVPESEEKAFYWYEKAAEQGHIEAQCQTALMYEYGDGVAKNKEKAMQWQKD